MREELRREILAMVEEDQRMRFSGVWDSEIDIRNTKKLKEIIEKFGWPNKSLVGEDGAAGAFLLAQHADLDPDFQKRALELLREAGVETEAEKNNEAHLADRVRVNSGLPQIFGTQFFTDADGKYGPRPIEDLEHLDERRGAHGLDPFAEYERRMQKINKEFKEKMAKKKLAP